MTPVKWANPYKFHAYRNAAQNTGNGAFAIVNFDTESFDSNSNFDVTTNIGRYTCPVDGFYYFYARLSASTTGQLLIGLYKNGTIVHRGGHSLSAAGTTGVTIGLMVQASATNYFEIYSFGSGGAMEVGPIGVYFGGYLVSQT